MYVLRLWFNMQTTAVNQYYISTYNIMSGLNTCNALKGMQTNTKGMY